MESSPALEAEAELFEERLDSEHHMLPHYRFVSHSLLCPLLPQAVGLGLDYVKLGGLSGAERMTKYNRLISIEEELAQQGILGGFSMLLPHLFFLA